jgi:hypothetical protein
LDTTEKAPVVARELGTTNLSTRHATEKLPQKPAVCPLRRHREYPIVPPEVLGINLPICGDPEVPQFVKDEVIGIRNGTHLARVEAGKEGVMVWIRWIAAEDENLPIEA